MLVTNKRNCPFGLPCIVTPAASYQHDMLVCRSYFSCSVNVSCERLEWGLLMEVPGGPHYPLLIIKGENRGYAALTKRFNWFESLLVLGPLRSRIGRNDHYVLIHWCPSLSPCTPNRIIKTGCVIPRLLDSACKRSLASLQNEWVVILIILSFYRYGHNTP